MQEIRLSISPRILHTDSLLLPLLADEIGVNISDISGYRVLKESLDARSREPKYHVTIAVFINEPVSIIEIPKPKYQAVHNAQPVLVVGSGPAGIFAALRLLELGFKPIIWERGKDVRARRFDLKAIQQDNFVSPDSNYCFGEGGAGTYSDGKLYTRSTKRGDVRKILEVLVSHGADSNILVNSHPHIGTNKLPKLVAELRETILEFGGEVHFNKRLIDIDVQFGKIHSATSADGDSIQIQHLILVTGHSARDIYTLLDRKGIHIEAKPFALGVRIEHPQHIIDSMQYKCAADRGPYLPAASYSIVQQVENRGVYSFCMCPGGFIVPSATAPGEIVVNGMSPSKRDNAFANSGLVVEVHPEDWKGFGSGPLAAMHYQEAIEQKAFSFGSGSQKAPAQRMVDFTQSKLSSDLNSTSYQPGLVSTQLPEFLPKEIHSRLRNACVEFGKRMKPYFTNEANLIGVESRTSSPVRIPRDKETLEHTSVKGLFPGGEGGGYAGGIISAAIDGERLAEAVAKSIL